MEINVNTEISISDPALRRAMYKCFDGKCFYTGRELSFDEMHIDHITPIEKGGGNNIANYVICCPYINLKKSKSAKYDLDVVVKAIVKELFADEVLNSYRQIKLNLQLLETHIELNEFLRGIEKKHRPTFRSYIRYHLTPLKVYKDYYKGKIKFKPKKAKLYYDKKDIEVTYNKWLDIKRK